MKIVFLDASSLGSVNLDIFKKFGEFVSYPLTKKEELEERIKDVEIIITNKVWLGKEEMEKAKKLKLIAISATGYNNVDLEEARERGIIVANVKGYSTESVAQLTLTYILAMSSSLLNYNRDVKKGDWAKSPIFTMIRHPFNNLKGKNLGIIGYGTIGKRVEELAKGFGMNILVGKRPGVNYEDDKRVSFERLLKESDYISLHCPLSDSTYKLFSEDEFKMMKNEAVLINTARGPVVDEEALYSALKIGEIKGACIDVMVEEPPREGNRLFELDNIIVTPHVAWASNESIQILIDGIVENIKLFKKGKLISL